MQTALKTVSVAADVRPAEPATIDVSHSKAELPMAVALQKMATAARTHPLKVMRDYSSLAFGPGRVSFRDYTNLRLFDDERYAGSDKKAVVGARRNRDIAVAVNYRHDWYGLFSNKIASIGYLAAFGLPTIPIVAVFALEVGYGGAKLLCDREELASFLRRSDVYPLFGKPAEGTQSLGSVGLVHYCSADDRIEKVDGTRIRVDAFVEDVVENYDAGYLFQPMMMPHRDIAALCGARLATCRMLTLLTEDGPQLYRAAWKLPAAGNAADNYWRSGNILAKIDLETGIVERAMTGAGFDLQEITVHPDTAAILIGARVPNWEAMKAVAIEGARVMREMPLIGWDIASGRDGPVIVEMNQTPDFILHQLADARGVLEPEFLAFMDYQKRNAAEHFRSVRADIAKL